MCEFSVAKFGDEVNLIAEYACSCGAFNSHRVKGTYLCHVGGYDVIKIHGQESCDGCGNVIETFKVPCNGIDDVITSSVEDERDEKKQERTICINGRENTYQLV